MIYIMVKTNFNQFPNAITRARNYGKSNLIYHVDKKNALDNPNIKDSAYTNTTADMPKRKKSSRNGTARFPASVVANNEFKASHNRTYQGFKTGVVNNRLPMSFIPAEIKSYDVNEGGSAYNNGSGEVAEDENRDEPNPPKLNTQWQSPNRTIATQWKPNPFPVEINSKVKIKG